MLDEVIAIAKQYQAQSVSLKYVDLPGQLRQIDVAITSLMSQDDQIMVGGLVLKPIPGKYFIDPFRCRPTIFCFCENILSSHAARRSAMTFWQNNHLVNNFAVQCIIDFTMTSSQQIDQLEAPSLFVDHQGLVEPDDQLANLRSEIIDILENIGIKTLFHCHASYQAQCQIAIEAQNFLAAADDFLIAQYVISNVGQLYGKVANFFASSQHNHPNHLTIKLQCSAVTDQQQEFFYLALQKNTEQLGRLITKAGCRLTVSMTTSHITILFIHAPINPYLVFTALLSLAVKPQLALTEIFPAALLQGPQGN